MFYADNRTSGRYTYNTAVGYQALRGGTYAPNNTGQQNTSIGYQALIANTSGSYNTATGTSALYANNSGEDNSAFGRSALYSNTSGNDNTATGNYSLFLNTTGYENVAIGYNAIGNSSGGYDNTAIGYNAFTTTYNYHNSTAIGANTSITATSQIRLGNTSVSSIGGYAAWTNLSDARLKTNVHENVVGLDFILKLRPVTYNLDMDAIARFNHTPDSLRQSQSEALKAAELQTGFLAQEVEAAAESVGYDFHGVDKPKNENDHYGLRYAEFVVPLVKAVQEQQQTIEKQQQTISKLMQRLDRLEKMMDTK